MRFSKLIRFRDSQLLLTTKLLVLSTLLGFTLNSQAQVSSTGKYSLSIRLSAAPLTHAVFTPGRVLAASRTELVKTPLVIDIGAKASASVTPMAPLRIDIINLASAGAQLKIESLSGGIKSVTGPTPTGAMVCAPNCAAPLLKDKAASFYLSVSMRPDYVGSQKALNESFVIDANGAKIPVTIRGQVFAAPELALYSNFGHYHYFSNQNPTQIPTFDFGQVKVGQDLPFEFMLGRSRVGTVSFSAWLPSNIAGMTRPVSVLGLENPNPSPTSPSVSGKIKALPGTNYIRFQTTAKGLAPQTKIIAWQLQYTGTGEITPTPNTPQPLAPINYSMMWQPRGESEMPSIENILLSKKIANQVVELDENPFRLDPEKATKFVYDAQSNLYPIIEARIKANNFTRCLVSLPCPRGSVCRTLDQGTVTGAIQVVPKAACAPGGQWSTNRNHDPLSQSLARQDAETYTQMALSRGEQIPFAPASDQSRSCEFEYSNSNNFSGAPAMKVIHRVYANVSYRVSGIPNQTHFTHTCNILSFMADVPLSIGDPSLKVDLANFKDSKKVSYLYEWPTSVAKVLPVSLSLGRPVIVDSVKLVEGTSTQLVLTGLSFPRSVSATQSLNFNLRLLPLPRTAKKTSTIEIKIRGEVSPRSIEVDDATPLLNFVRSSQTRGNQ